MTATARTQQFLALHTPGTPLLMPNAWDIGSAALFASLGFEAIATTSGGFAATRGRLDGAMTKDEVLAHCRRAGRGGRHPGLGRPRELLRPRPRGRRRHHHGRGRARPGRRLGGGLHGQTGTLPSTSSAHAADRVRAAAEAAHAGPVPFVLTARAENYLHGRRDLADTIARLQAYQEAGADVLFAPAVVDPERPPSAARLRSTSRSASSSCPARPPWASWVRWA